MIKMHTVLATPQHDSWRMWRTYKYPATASTYHSTDSDHVQVTTKMTTLNYLLLSRHIAWDGIR